MQLFGMVQFALSTIILHPKVMLRPAHGHCASLSALQLFGMVQIAKRPAHKYITRDKADLVTSSNALVSADTGAILPTVQHKAFVPDKKLEGRFDKVIVVLVTPFAHNV
jgi:hypothetical protein